MTSEMLPVIAYRRESISTPAEGTAVSLYAHADTHSSESFTFLLWHFQQSICVSVIHLMWTKTLAGIRFRPLKAHGLFSGCWRGADRSFEAWGYGWEQTYRAALINGLVMTYSWRRREKYGTIIQIFFQEMKIVDEGMSLAGWRDLHGGPQLSVIHSFTPRVLSLLWFGFGFG